MQIDLYDFGWGEEQEGKLIGGDEAGAAAYGVSGL